MPVILKNNNCILSARINQFDHSLFNKQTNSKKIFFEDSQKQTIEFIDSKWNIECNTKNVSDKINALDIEITFNLITGTLNESNVGIELIFNNWSADNYVLLPGAAYNGNRFESRRISYSPKILDPRDIGFDKPTIISDVPRLNIKEGPSFIQERSGSMTVPSIGFHDPFTKMGCWILTTQGNQLGDYGINITESKDRKKAYISINAPLVRELYKYRITDNQFPSDDVPVDFKEGDCIKINARIYFFPSPDIQSLFDFHLTLRNDLVKREDIPFIFPFSSTFKIQEKKFNEQNFVPEQGYYSVGVRENFLQDWQIGWTGGMISTYPLLFDGNEETRKNVVRNFNWLFPNGISPSGFFWDSGKSEGKIMNWYGGDIRKPHTKNWHLVRKSGDGLFFVIKQLMLMKKIGIQINPVWENGTQGVANAFVRLWKKWNQLGNFVDSITGDIAVGGSTSGAIVPAALVLAYRYFKNEEFLVVAKESANYFYSNYVSKGITNGGPGDAMQNPDSESSYAMLESFTILYEETSDPIFLKMAEAMASQFASWVMSYNYEFPKNCNLAKLNIKTTGTVCANTQNKHGAPGICTHSGVALLRLYRATNNMFYLNLLKDITNHIPQMMSHPARPIDKMNIGWITERVSTTDWLEGIGEIMYGTTWAETALLLTGIEIPAIYVIPDKSFVFNIDLVESEIVENTTKQLKIRVSNPSKSEADFKIWIENSIDKTKKIDENFLFDSLRVHLKSGESKNLEFNK